MIHSFLYGRSIWYMKFSSLGPSPKCLDPHGLFQDAALVALEALQNEPDDTLLVRQLVWKTGKLSRV